MTTQTSNNLQNSTAEYANFTPSLFSFEQDADNWESFVLLYWFVNLCLELTQST